MKKKLDAIDRKILELLQTQSDWPINELAAAVHLTPTPCWRRVQRLKELGILARQVALVDRQKVNLGVTVFVAIRTREFEPDSNITIRRLAETRRVLAASPRYLAQHGFPKSLDDLQRHKLLIYTYANTPNDLRFQRDGQVSTVHAKGLLESNDGQILRSAALEGLGILVQPSYIVYEDIVAGRLVPLLEDWDLPRLTINLAYPNRKHLSAKVRTFVDFMAERFLAQGFERKWTTRFANPS